MLNAKGLMLSLMLASLQGNRNNVANANNSTLSKRSLNSTTLSPSILTFVTAPSVTPPSPTGVTKLPEMKSNTQNNDINPASPQTTHTLNFTNEGDNHFPIRNNRTSLPSSMPTTSSYSSATISKSDEATLYVTSSETRSKNSTTAIYDTNFTSMVSSNKTQMDYATVHPTNNLLNASTMQSKNYTTAIHNANLTSMVSSNKTQVDYATVNPTSNVPNASTALLTTNSNSVTVNLKSTTQTTSQDLNSTESSAAAREHQKEKHSHGAVVFGAIVGAVLGSALIGLIGYFMFGKRKAESFGHQRLYDDARNDPVLRLDSPPDPYESAFGHLSCYNPTTANETAAQDRKETSYDTIPMEDLISPHPTV